MSDPEREMAKERLVRVMADIDGYERRLIWRAMREWYRNGSPGRCPVARLVQSFTSWGWTFPEWDEMFDRSGELRKRELRRTATKRTSLRVPVRDQRKKRREYMRNYMRARRSKEKSKSVDLQTRG